MNGISTLYPPFRLAFTLTALCLALPLQSASAQTPAQDTGDWFSQDYLTGSWGGLRPDLASQGVALDAAYTIDAFAKNSPQPDVIYAKASVEPPRDKSPLGKPATPTKLSISLDTQGRANLTWGGTRHGGTVFQVQRRVVALDGQERRWETVATVAERRFVDEATPGGVRGVSYRVRGERSGGVSAYTLGVTLPLGAVAGPVGAGDERQAG